MATRVASSSVTRSFSFLSLLFIIFNHLVKCTVSDTLNDQLMMERTQAN